MLEWSDLLAALAIFLVLEGLAPFANPAGLKRALTRLLSVSDRDLRIAGLGSMTLGLLLLWAARG
jgi:uncharacterized protein YjeT (DUF2065 family)